MIEKISLQIADESGSTVEVKESKIKLQSTLDIAIADFFSQIIFYQQGIVDDEIKLAEKFRLAHALSNYLKELDKKCIEN